EGDRADHRDRHPHRLEQGVPGVQAREAQGRDHAALLSVRARKASSRVAPRTCSCEKGRPDATSARTNASESCTEKATPSPSGTEAATPGSVAIRSGAGVARSEERRA